MFQKNIVRLQDVCAMCIGVRRFLFYRSVL